MHATQSIQHCVVAFPAIHTCLLLVYILVPFIVCMSKNMHVHNALGFEDSDDRMCVGCQCLHVMEKRVAVYYVCIFLRFV